MASGGIAKPFLRDLTKTDANLARMLTRSGSGPNVRGERRGVSATCSIIQPEHVGLTPRRSPNAVLLQS
jgi:hypothetical protein